MFEKIVKTFARFLVFALIFWAAERFCHKQTDGFAMSKIRSHFAPEKRWQSAPMSDEVEEILAQPFTYLARGVQCYAFVSQDQKYVLKLLRTSQLEAPHWLTRLPLPDFLASLRAEKIAHKEGKRERDFTSYKIAYDLLREETGLIHIQLNQNPALKQRVIVTDKLGIQHSVDMGAVQFILQKRASPFYSTVEELLALEKKDAIKVLISDLVELLCKRRKLGLSDKDPDLLTNFGTVQDKPIQIDIGRFKPFPKQATAQEELVYITDRFNQWLKMRAPELSQHLEREICAASD